MHEARVCLLYLERLAPLPIWILTFCPFYIIREVILANIRWFWTSWVTSIFKRHADIHFSIFYKQYLSIGFFICEQPVTHVKLVSMFALISICLVDNSLFLSPKFTVVVWSHMVSNKATLFWSTRRNSSNFFRTGNWSCTLPLVPLPRLLLLFDFRLSRLNTPHIRSPLVAFRKKMSNVWEPYGDWLCNPKISDTQWFNIWTMEALSSMMTWGDGESTVP